MRCRWNNKFVRIIRVVLLVSISAVALAQDTRVWKKLSEDGLHDPDIEALSLMQEPEAALGELPYDYVGNKVKWVQALAEGYIEPRTNIYPGTEIRISNLDIVMGNTGEAGLVLFPHRQHTEWLDCSNCHDGIFVEKVDANPISMLSILNGEYCGVCHGAVSFPLVECNRCHSIPRSTFTGKMGAQNSQPLE
jgi:c(7)-type cytochrome triheme protein